MAHAANEIEMEAVFDELCARFLLSLPETDFESFERLLFAVESAHWFYEDVFRDKNPALPKYKLKDFTTAIFSEVPVLHQHIPNIDRLFTEWMAYKTAIATAGCALLSAPDSKNVLLVKGMGKGARWGFPKGKLGKDECDLNCARREVLEETGFDVTPLVSERTHYFESHANARRGRIYVVPGVPKDFPFAPKTKGEIGDIAWHPVSSLPEDFQGPNNNQFWGVVPFVRRLRAWIQRNSKARKQNHHHHHHHQQHPASPPPKTKKKKNMAPASASRGSHGRQVSKKDAFIDDAGHLTDLDRQSLFDQYVTSANKRIAEDKAVFALHHEMEDMGLDNRKYMEDLNSMPRDHDQVNQTRIDNRSYLEACHRDQPGDIQPGSTTSFAFDWGPILACFS